MAITKINFILFNKECKPLPELKSVEAKKYRVLSIMQMSADDSILIHNHSQKSQGVSKKSQKFRHFLGELCSSNQEK